MLKQLHTDKNTGETSQDKPSQAEGSEMLRSLIGIIEILGARGTGIKKRYSFMWALIKRA